MNLFKRNKVIKVSKPIQGDVIPLETVNDPVFSQKMIGDGVAILPKDNKLYSPVDGTVNVVFPTKHVIGITTKEGIELVMHVGLDTVELNGMYFDPKVKVGDVVKKNDLLMTMDLESIKKQYDPTVMLVFTNLNNYLLVHEQEEDYILKLEKR